MSRTAEAIERTDESANDGTHGVTPEPQPKAGRDAVGPLSGGPRLFDARVWLICGLLFVGSFVAYGLGSWKLFWKQSDNIHFVDLAHSFWKGQWWTLWSHPNQGPWKHRRDNDWGRLDYLTVHNIGKVKGTYVDQKTYGYNFYTTDGRGLIVDNSMIERNCGPHQNHFCRKTRWFVSFPPTPAVLMMPLVKIWDWRVNDVWFTIAFASLNVVLIFLLVRLLTLRGHCERSEFEAIILAISFGFGTVAFFSSVRGEVWFTALIVGVSFNLLYLLAALDARHPLLAGIALAFAFGSRTATVFGALFFFLQLAFPNGKFIGFGDGLKKALPKALWFILPCLIAGIALLLYNHARFDSYTEFGHRYLPNWAGDRIRLTGIFSPRYLSRNLASAFAQVPVFVSTKPYFKISHHGLALWFTTPMFFYLLWPKVKGALHTHAWIALAVVAAPIFLYQNTGWLQFGFRFALDFMPYMFLLLAIGGRKIGKLYLGLLVFAIAVNLFGALSFNRWPEYYFLGFLEP